MAFRGAERPLLVQRDAHVDDAAVLENECLTHGTRRSGARAPGRRAADSHVGAAVFTTFFTNVIEVPMSAMGQTMNVRAQVTDINGLESNLVDFNVALN